MLMSFQQVGAPSKAHIGLVLLVCGVTGGSIFVLVKALSGVVTPVQLVTARVVLAALALNLVLLTLRKPPRMNGATLRAGAILAVFDAVVPYILIAWAAAHILASTSALLIATMPLLTALFVSATDRIAVARSTALGLVVGAMGVSILAGPGALDFGSSRLLAMLAVLVAATSYAGSAVYSRVALRAASPVELSATKFTIASVFLIPLVALNDPATYLDLSSSAWLALCGVGFLATGLARCGYVWVISVAGSVSASLLTYIVPVATLILAWTFTNEILTWAEGVGALLVCVSVTIVMFGSALAALFQRWRMPPRSPELAEPGASAS